MAKKKLSLEEGRRRLEKLESETQELEDELAKAEAQKEVHMAVLGEYEITSIGKAKKKLEQLEKNHSTLSDKASNLLDKAEAKLEEFSDD